MNKTEKEATVQALHEKLAKATFVAAVSFAKLDALSTVELRKGMRGAGVDYQVVKNTLAKLAAKGTAAEQLGPQLEGPVAMAIAYGDLVQSAKTLTELFKKAPEGSVAIKAAVAQKETFDAKGVEALSKLPGLPETRARLLALMLTPATQIVRILSTPGQQLARAIQLHSESEAKAAA